MHSIAWTQLRSADNSTYIVMIDTIDYKVKDHIDFSHKKSEHHMDVVGGKSSKLWSYSQKYSKCISTWLNLMISFVSNTEQNSEKGLFKEEAANASWPAHL